MTPILYRYRDSESVIKPMEGYTPTEGWEPLYDQAAMDAAEAAERERCAKVCEAIEDDYIARYVSARAKMPQNLAYLDGASDGAEKCAYVIRKGTE